MSIIGNKLRLFGLLFVVSMCGCSDVSNSREDHNWASLSFSHQILTESTLIVKATLKGKKIFQYQPADLKNYNYMNYSDLRILPFQLLESDSKECLWIEHINTHAGLRRAATLSEDIDALNLLMNKYLNLKGGYLPNSILVDRIILEGQVHSLSTQDDIISSHDDQWQKVRSRYAYTLRTDDGKYYWKIDSLDREIGQNAYCYLKYLNSIVGIIDEQIHDPYRLFICLFNETEMNDYNDVFFEYVFSPDSTGVTILSKTLLTPATYNYRGTTW